MNHFCYKLFSFQPINLCSEVLDNIYHHSSAMYGQSLEKGRDGRYLGCETSRIVVLETDVTFLMIYLQIEKKF